MKNLKDRLLWVLGKPEDGNRKQPILTASIIGNVIFVFLLFESELPTKFIIFLFGILLFAPPIIFGYSKRTFLTSVGVGALPLFSLGLEIGNHGIPREYIVNMLQSGIFYAGLGLPVVTISYRIGVFAREHLLRGEHARRFAWQALLMLTLTFIIFMIRFTTNLLSTEVVH